MIVLCKQRDNDKNGERFRLKLQDPAGRKPGYHSDTFPDLTEDDLREMLGLIDASDVFADRLLQNARAEFLSVHALKEFS